MSDLALVYESNPINGRLLTMFLLQLGYKSEVFGNIKDLYGKDFDSYKLVFIDYNYLQICDIKDFVTVVKGCANPPYIIAVLNGHCADDEAYKSLGIDRSIVRPISVKILKEVINSLENNCCQASSKDAAVNLEQVGKSLGITDMSLLKTIFQQFFDMVPTELDELKKAAQTRDFSQIREKAHSIKGSSRNLRLNAIGDAAECIESHAKSCDNVDYVHLSSELDDICRSASRYFSENYKK